MSTEHEPFSGGDDENFMVDGDLTGNLPSETEYLAKLIDLEKDESKSGNPMFVWTIEIIRELESGDTEYAGWDKKVYTALTDAAMWKVNEVLTAFGLGTVRDGRIVANFKKSDAIGRKCVIEIEHGEYNGQPTADIAKVKAYEGAAPGDDDIPF